jgi:sugar lactone lactonase YvrE
LSAPGANETGSGARVVVERRTPLCMQKHLVCAATLLVACHTSSAAHSGDAKGSFELTGFEQPESVLHDERDDVYLVSNVAGSPFEADGRGYISRVSADGKLLAQSFIAGLNAPKGLAIHGEVLAVADLTVLRRFERKSGTAIDVVPLPGATFLNDVVAAPDGSFYVSDTAMRATGESFEPTGSDAIYRVRENGAVDVVSQGPQLALPNGLAVHDDELWMVSFGTARLVRYALDGSVRGELPLPAGQLDGLLALDGCVVASSMEGVLLHGREPGALTRGPALLAMDIGFDQKRGRVLLPNMMDGSLRGVPLHDVAPGCE